MDSTANFHSKYFKDNGVVIVGIIGSSLAENSNFLNRLLNNSVSFPTLSEIKNYNAKFSQQKFQMDPFSIDLWPRGMFQYYLDEENKVVYVLLSVPTHSNFDFFASDKQKDSESVNETHSKNIKIFPKDSQIQLRTYEWIVLKAMLLIFLVCHVVLFIQDKPRLDLKLVQYFRWLKASKLSIFPFLKTFYVQNSSLSATSSLSSSSASFYPSSSLSLPSTPVFSSTLSPSSSSFRPSPSPSPSSFPSHPYTYPPPPLPSWNSQVKTKLQPFPVSMSTERQSSAITFSPANQHSPHSFPPTIFPCQLLPTALFVFPYTHKHKPMLPLNSTEFNSTIQSIKNENKNLKTNSAVDSSSFLQGNTNPSLKIPSSSNFHSSEKNASSPSESTRKKLQASLEAHVRYVLKKLNILTHIEGNAIQSTVQGSSNSNINIKSKSNSNSNSSSKAIMKQKDSNESKEEDAGLFILDSSCSAVLDHFSDSGFSSMDALSSKLLHAFDLEEDVSRLDMDSFESVMNMHEQSIHQGSNGMQVIKEFIQRQVAVLRGKENSSSSSSPQPNRVQIEPGKGESTVRDKIHSSHHLASFSSWMKYCHALSSSIQSKEFTPFDLFTDSYTKKMLNMDYIEKRLSSSPPNAPPVDDSMHPSIEKVRTPFFDSSEKSNALTHAIRPAMECLSTVADLDLAFSKNWCQNALSKAMDLYKRDLPPLYTLNIHLSHCENALSFFKKKAKGPAVTFYSECIRFNCDAMWKEGRQRCESVSLTRHHCIHPLHPISNFESLDPALRSHMNDVELSLYSEYMHSLKSKTVTNLDNLFQRMNTEEDYVQRVKDGLSIDSEIAVENDSSINHFHCSSYLYMQSCSCGSHRFIKNSFLFPINEEEKYFTLLSSCCRSKTILAKLSETSPFESQFNPSITVSSTYPNPNPLPSSFLGKSHPATIRISLDSDLTVFHLDFKHTFESMDDFPQPGFVSPSRMSFCSLPFFHNLPHPSPSSSSLPAPALPKLDSKAMSKDVDFLQPNSSASTKERSLLANKDENSGNRKGHASLVHSTPAPPISSILTRRQGCKEGDEEGDADMAAASKLNAKNGSSENANLNPISISKSTKATAAVLTKPKDLSYSNLNMQSSAFPPLPQRDASTLPLLSSPTPSPSPSPSNAILSARQGKTSTASMLNSEGKGWTLKSQFDNDKSVLHSSPSSSVSSERMQRLYNAAVETFPSSSSSSSSSLPSTNVQDYPPLSECRKQEKKGKQKEKSSSIIFSNSLSFKILQHDAANASSSPKNASSPHAASDANEKLRKGKEEREKEKEKEEEENLEKDILMGFEHECCQGHRFFLTPSILSDVRLLPFETAMDHFNTQAEDSKSVKESQKDKVKESRVNAGEKDWGVASSERVFEERRMHGRGGYRGKGGGKGRSRGRGENVHDSRNRGQSERIKFMESNTHHLHSSESNRGNDFLHTDLPVFLKCPYCTGIMHGSAIQNQIQSQNQNQNQNQIKILSSSEKETSIEPVERKEEDVVFSQLRRVFVVTPDNSVLVVSKPIIEFEILNHTKSDTFQSGVKVAFNLSSEIPLPPSSTLCMHLPFNFPLEERRGGMVGHKDAAAAEDRGRGESCIGNVSEEESGIRDDLFSKGIKCINSLVYSSLASSSIGIRSRLVSGTILYAKNSNC